MAYVFLALLAVAGVLYTRHALADEGLGAAVLRAGQRALAQGVAETATNTGPKVDAYLKAVGIAPPANWCAAAVTAWIQEGCREIGRDSPMNGGAQAKGFIPQFERMGKWVPKDRIKSAAIMPGSVVIWSRGDPKSWTGHIGIIEETRGNVLFTIEGNSGPKGDRVARMTRKLDDERLLGVGVW